MMYERDDMKAGPWTVYAVAIYNHGAGVWDVKEDMDGWATYQVRENAERELDYLAADRYYREDLKIVQRTISSWVDSTPQG